jgi:hypothetical protein
MKRFMCVFAVLSALAMPLAIGQQPPAPGGGKVEPNGPRHPSGKLGDDLGAYLTIEGMKLEEGKVGERTLIVNTVNGKRLKKPIPIWIHNLDLPSKTRCVFKGYETGHMIGTPPAVYEAAKEQGREVGGGQAAWQWHSFFVVLIVAEPKGLELPKDEGTARVVFASGVNRNQ